MTPRRIRDRLRRISRAIITGVAVAAATAVIAFLVREKFDPLIHADDRAIVAATDVTRAHPRLLDALLTWQEVTQPRYVYIVATLVCLWVWRGRGLTTRAWWAFVTMMVGWNLALDVKYLVQRARPVVSDPVSHAPGYSFPSGHAANAAIGAATVVLLLWPLLRPRGRTVAVLVGAVVVVLTSLDRVFLGVHYPSDVTGGVLFGAGLVVASYLGYLGWNPVEAAAHTLAPGTAAGDHASAPPSHPAPKE